MTFATRVVSALLFAFGVAAAGGVIAQSTWTAARPIKLVVPYAPGGGTDVLARIVAQGLGNSLGQPVVVENRPGANGIVGANALYAAPADGTNLLFAAADFISVAPHIYTKEVTFQPNGFKAVAPVAKMGFVLAGRADSEVKTLAQLVAKAKSKDLSYSHWGPGSMAQMGMELFKSKAAIPSMLQVPYGGAGPAMTALLGGQVDLAFVPTPLAVANRDRLTFYALGSPQRFPAIKDVPTLSESGYPIDSDTWFGVLAPPGTPQAAIDAIQAQVTKVVNDTATRARFSEMGYTPFAGDPRAFGKFVEMENSRWGGIVKAANIKVE
jgi:tripartite-type tricarboxylate transporter receptor subunit TctC